MKVLSVDGLSKLITLMKGEFASSSSLSTVATSGSYNDLSNKPTIPEGLPSQSGNSGKFLTTNGTTASWGTITIPTVDQTYDGTSANAQSGVAIAGAGFLTNKSNRDGSYIIGNNNTSDRGGGTIIIGDNVKGAGYNDSGSIRIGYRINTNNYSYGNGVYIGQGIQNAGGRVIISGYNTNSSSSIVGNNSGKIGGIIICSGQSQIGPNKGVSSILIAGNEYGSSQVNADYTTFISSNYNRNDVVTEDNTFWWANSNGLYKIIDSDGKIPDDRLNTTIARTSQIPTTTSQLTNNSGFITGISWGDITGTLSSQSDLNTALNNKANDSSVVHLSGDETINGGKTFNQAFIIGTTETHPNEGGQLIFKKSHNSTMAGDVIVDQNVNNLRVIGQSTSLGIIVPFYIDCENNKVYTATPTTGDNSTQVATTAFVKAQGYATTSQIPTVATTSTAGLVKPDGTSITIDSNGTISAAGGSAYAMVIVDYTEEDE